MFLKNHLAYRNLTVLAQTKTHMACLFITVQYFPQLYNLDTINGLKLQVENDLCQLHSNCYIVSVDRDVSLASRFIRFMGVDETTIGSTL